MIPRGNAAGALFTAVMTEDAAAAAIVGAGGPMVLHAFCLNCGSTWLPADLHAARALAGEWGPEIQKQVRTQLEAMVKQGSGFIVDSNETREKAKWAKRILDVVPQ